MRIKIVIGLAAVILGVTAARDLRRRLRAAIRAFKDPDGDHLVVVGGIRFHRHED